MFLWFPRCRAWSSAYSWELGANWWRGIFTRWVNELVGSQLISGPYRISTIILAFLPSEFANTSSDAAISPKMSRLSFVLRETSKIPFYRDLWCFTPVLTCASRCLPNRAHFTRSGTTKISFYRNLSCFTRAFKRAIRCLPNCARFARFCSFFRYQLVQISMQARSKMRRI